MDGFRMFMLFLDHPASMGLTFAGLIAGMLVGSLFDALLVGALVGALIGLVVGVIIEIRLIARRNRGSGGMG